MTTRFVQSDRQAWLSQGPGAGFFRIAFADTEFHSRLRSCSLIVSLDRPATRNVANSKPPYSRLRVQHLISRLGGRESKFESIELFSVVRTPEHFNPYDVLVEVLNADDSHCRSDHAFASLPAGRRDFGNSMKRYATWFVAPASLGNIDCINGFREFLVPQGGESIRKLVREFG